MVTINGTAAHIIFTGGGYWAVAELPKTTSDFAMVSGLRWIKSRKVFSSRW